MYGKEQKKNKALTPVRRWTLPIAVFLFAAIAGCSIFGSDGRSAESIDQKIDKEVWRMRDMYVRLEAQDKLKGAAVAPNQHPVNIAPEQLYNAFAQITVKTDEKYGYLPLFSEFELKTLSNNVSTALAEASPAEDVTFALVGWHKGGGGLFGAAVQQVTTGRVFYQNGQVNLILGDAHRDVQEGENFASQPAQTGDRRLDPFVPGMRSFTRPHKWQIAAASNSGVYSAPGGQRHDWLVFSAQALAAAPPPAEDRPTNNAAEQARYEQLQKQVDQLQQQLQTMRQNQAAPAYQAQPAQPAYPGYYQYPAAPGYPAQPAPPGNQYPANPAPGTYGSAAPPAPAYNPAGETPSGGNSIQQRLMVLDDLKNKGLISDTEYQQKRNEILSGR